ncbi:MULTISPECIES: type II toxin-antitoxin system RelB/DinJ family antitoxin [Lactobacillus]|uniref:Type II toxin-antitoxin system RelB/DinJ family antitoxin n=1 Tax=Lactobacillus xujianguonis TaxID=2495899 RepID=A0A437SVP1_9LACO|nr:MULTISPECIES: type II toxin-antitoxin system RelB/DinJ family antitoxin [Lactobacillus]RVU70991.1 type II toxin-antitoxin system RelB/DinJ family antitoxin [Lactobacillus xujianguonis]RVU73939.1 type II toxin-antitoxin system RelB/DinJ family antitoxin [Lactobacillus xujianguonis]
MAEKTSGLYVRMSPEKKEKAEEILKKLGLNSATAINMFYDQIILHNGIPFRVEIPNAWDNLDQMNKYEFTEYINQKLNRLNSDEDISLGRLVSEAEKAKDSKKEE